MVKIELINASTFEPQQYSEGDENTIPSFGVDSSFSLENGRVEALVYNLNNNLISYDPDAKYSVVENTLGNGPEFASNILLFPEDEIRSLGIEVGKYNIAYNFLNNELNSSFEQQFSISEISANRKEIRLISNFTTEEELKTLVEEFYPTVSISPTYPDFYLNFGQGRLYIANNCLFDSTNGRYSVLIKLYDALPSSFQEKDTAWVTTEQRETIAYSIEYEQEPYIIKNTIDLKGPNFSLPLNNNIHNSVELKNFNELNSPSGISTSSYNQLQSILQEKGVEINIDYTKFDNFIHFSTAKERIDNFHYKVSLIESTSLQWDAQPTGSISTHVSSSKSLLKNKISNIIENFDGFEYWMYYSSGSYSSYPQPYPKTNSSPPYLLSSTGSADSIIWYDSSSVSASTFDQNNQDILTQTIPEYILEDSNNEPYKKFVSMVGQHFDTLFTYTQDITNRYNADNRLDLGISKDLVAEAIKSMGVNLHTGNFNATDLVSSYIGISGSNGYLPPLPSGQDMSLITNYVTASNFPTPIEDINKEIYKRIYHNLPLLLKKKGSVAGLRTLITTFGIPDDILKIREYSITGKPTIQQLPNSGSGESGSISFPTTTISLPQTSSHNFVMDPNTLSSTVRVQQDYMKDEKYDRSLHYVEAGFSPQNYLDDALSSSSEITWQRLTEDPGFYIGDFNDFNFGEGNTYSDLSASATPFGGTPWNTAAYIRYIKFLDSSLFSMIKDFTPVRSSTITGVIIKPTLRERNIQRPASMSIQDLTLSGSVYTEGYDWATSESITRAIGQRQAYHTSSGKMGGTGGSFSDFNRYEFAGTATTTWGTPSDLPTPISSSFRQLWSEKTFNSGITGSHILSHSSQEEFYNGIFKQTGQVETRSSNISNPTGHFQTDNNPANPYKKALPVATYALNAKGIVSLLQILANIASVNKAVGVTPYENTYEGEYDTFFFNKDFTEGGLEIGTVIEGNGSTLSLRHSSGRLYVMNVLSVSEWLVADVVQVAVSYSYVVGNRTVLIDEDMSNGQTITFEPNWDPYTTIDVETNPGPFLYSDYNPLINNTADPGLSLENYEGLRKSTLYQDADYSGAGTSSLIPINSALLKIGSASKAAIPDSNYSSKFWIRSRYEGSRNSSLDFNSSIITVAPSNAALFTTESLGFDFNQISLTASAPYNPGGGLT
jgi:hypothetical protein